MSRFIRELRRREVFRTLGLYVGICWILLQAGSILLPAFDSPRWVLRALIVMAAAGFPVAGVLAWIYDIKAGHVRRESETVSAPADSLRGRKMDFVVIGVLAAALTFSVYLNLRGRTEIPDGLEPVSVLIADFENRTGDSIFDGLLEHALTLGVQNAPHIAVFDRNHAESLAAEIDSSINRLPPDTARLIGVRQGLGVVLAGSIESANRGFRLRLSGLEPTSGDSLFQVSEDAADRDGVLGAVASLSVAVRGALGDPTLRTVDPVKGSRAGDNAETFTTSLEAAKAESIGAQLVFEGRHGEAVESYRRATELDPSFAAAYGGWAISEYELGRREIAASLFEKALSLTDKMSEHDRLAMLGNYYYVTQSYEKALESLSELAEHYPADGAALNNVAVMAFMTLDFDRALAEGKRTLDIFPNARLYRSNYALYAMYAGEFDLAAQEARRVVDAYPGYGVAYLPIAMAHLVSKDFDGARTAYRSMGTATDGRLGRSAATLGLADVEMYVGSFDGAREILLPGIATDIERGAEYAAALKQIALAEARIETGELESAAESAKRAVELSPTLSIKLPAALVLRDAGQIDESNEIAGELAGALQPHNRAYGMMLRAVDLRGNGQLVAAIELLESALDVADLWRIRLELGRAYLEAGYFPQAYDEFQRCRDRRGEATALFLEDMPTFRYLAHLPYWLGRAQEGLNATDAAMRNYSAFLELRPAGGVFVEDARMRRAALSSGEGAIAAR
jgi:tetratricopeptide (TPR) repeat protein